jgi:hypothetical protein
MKLAQAPISMTDPVYGTKLLMSQIVEFVDNYKKESLWIIALISCDTRKLVPVLAHDATQVGRYIKSHITELMPFFRHMGSKCDEFDEIAERLYEQVTAKQTELFDRYYENEGGQIFESVEELIADDNYFVPIVESVLNEFNDDQIVEQFYAYSVSHEYKVCIDGPLSV